MEPVAKFRSGDKVKNKISGNIYTVGAFYHSPMFGVFRYIMEKTDNQGGLAFWENELEKVPHV